MSVLALTIGEVDDLRRLFCHNTQGWLLPLPYLGTCSLRSGGLVIHRRLARCAGSLGTKAQRPVPLGASSHSPHHSATA